MAIEAKAYKLERLWRKVCQKQTCVAPVVDKPWPSKCAADVVDLVDRWQISLMESSDFSDANAIRNIAIQLALRKLRPKWICCS